MGLFDCPFGPSSSKDEPGRQCRLLLTSANELDFFSWHRGFVIAGCTFGRGKLGKKD